VVESGLIARWARAGTRLHYCLLTDGTSGSRDPDMAPAALAEQRCQEQQDAGAIFGVECYSFLGYPDGAWRHERSAHPHLPCSRHATTPERERVGG